MKRIKKIGVLSLATYYTVFMAIIGAVVGLFYALLGTIIGANQNSTALGAGLGLLAIIVMPILYAIIGFITGALGALLFNLVAKITGGVEIQLEEKSPQPVS